MWRWEERSRGIGSGAIVLWSRMNPAAGAQPPTPAVLWEIATWQLPFSEKANPFQAGTVLFVTNAAQRCCSSLLASRHGTGCAERSPPPLHPSPAAAQRPIPEANSQRACPPAPLQIITQVQTHPTSSGLRIPSAEELPAGAFPGWAQYLELMEACWQRDPAERPSFDAIVQQLRCGTGRAGAAGARARSQHWQQAPLFALHGVPAHHLVC